MKKHVFVSAVSGRAKRRGELDKLLAALKQQTEVEIYLLDKGEDPLPYARQLAQEGAEVVGVAGGDGTLSAVANGLARSDTALCVIPFGTLNHFAADLRIPLQPEAAAKYLSISNAQEKRIDLGLVNGRYFLNNSSIGLYPHLARLRENREQQWGKWGAYALAALSTLRHPRRVPLKVQVSLPDMVSTRPFKVWLVFAASNNVELKLPRPGIRTRLDEGLLDVYVLEARSTLDLFQATLAFLAGRIEKSPLLSEHKIESFEVITKRNRRINVACDGEVFRMRPPFNYKIVPGALKVRCEP